MELFKNGNSYGHIEPLFINKKLIVAIDGSKTNSAMFVANEYGVIITDYEFRGISEDDILLQCWWIRRTLSMIFKGSKIIVGGIENIVTENDERGKSEHTVRYKLTSIMNSFIFYFQDNHNFTLELVNNWLWKSKTLPEEFRSGIYKSKEKGSLAYHRSISSKYAYRKDDITDAYQILQFLKMEHNISSTIKIDSVLEMNLDYDYYLASIRTNTYGYIEFNYNKEFPIFRNVSFVSNNLSGEQIGFFTIPTTACTPELIYEKCRGIFQQEEYELKVIVMKKGRFI